MPLLEIMQESVSQGCCNVPSLRELISRCDALIFVCIEIYAVLN